MVYMIFLALVSIFWCLTIAIGGDVANFIDISSLTVLLVPCLLALFATKSFGDFKNAVVFMFRPNQFSLKECKQARQSVHLVILSLFFSSILSFAVGVVNSFSTMNLSALDDVYIILVTIAIALISIAYFAYFATILLPISFSLKKHIISAETQVIKLSKSNVSAD